MNIQNYNNSYNISYGHKRPKPTSSWGRFKDRVKQMVLDTFPEFTPDIKNHADTFDKCTKEMAHPAVNRAIMGVTALATQPAIDYYNHRVDEETRTVSRNRTIAKIVAGTSVGILVRGLSYELVNKMTNLKGKGKFSRALIPDKSYLKKFLKDSGNLINNHKNALAWGLAMLAMCVTNFVLDAPLTVYFTNKLNAKSAKKKQAKEANHG